MLTELERRARAILRAVYARRRNREAGATERLGMLPSHEDAIVMAAITRAFRAGAASMRSLQAQQPDPCPQCPPGAICKKPSCGRLVSQQPGAQAVGMLTIRGALADIDLAYFGSLAPGNYAIYTHPQPPSGTTPVVTIPEPSEDDVDAGADAILAVCDKAVVNRIACVEFADQVLTTYTARLRERIGGGS